MTCSEPSALNPKWLRFRLFPHKQRSPQARPGAVQGAERGKAVPLMARTGPYNLALRERGAWPALRRRSRLRSGLWIL